MSSNLKANCCGLSTGYRKLSFPSLSFPSVGCRKPKKVGKHWFRLSMKRFSMFSITRLYVRDYFSSFCVTTRSQRLHFKLRWSSSRVNISGCHWCKPINWALFIPHFHTPPRASKELENVVLCWSVTRMPGFITHWCWLTSFFMSCHKNKITTFAIIVFCVFDNGDPQQLLGIVASKVSSGLCAVCLQAGLLPGLAVTNSCAPW